MTNVTPLTTADGLPTPYDQFGVQCGPGWRCLVEPLMELCTAHGYRVVQVKEKFGGLRFYVMDGDGTLDTVIAAIETASFEVCEDCGLRELNYDPQLREWQSVVTTRAGNNRTGWVRSLCPACREKWDV